MIISPDQKDFGIKLRKALGLPEHTKSFELRVAVNEVVSCKAEVYCDVNSGDLETILIEYDLVKK